MLECLSIEHAFLDILFLSYFLWDCNVVSLGKEGRVGSVENLWVLLKGGEGRVGSVYIQY